MTEPIDRALSQYPSESRLAIRVRYVECDPMGYLHHSNYLPFFEMGRTELLRLRGISYRTLEQEGFFFVVAKISVSFKRAARYDDQLDLLTRIVRQTHVRIDHAYEIYNTADNRLLCTAETTIACVNRQGQVIAIPAGLSGSAGAAP